MRSNRTFLHSHAPVLWGSLCALAACQNNVHGNHELGSDKDFPESPTDLSPPPADLSHPPATKTTIREINQGQVATDVWVQVDGVVTAPYALAYAMPLTGQCVYERTMLQPSLSPTLHDGMLLRAIETVQTGDMGLTQGACQARAAASVLGKWPLGESITVIAPFAQVGSLRFLNLTTGEIQSHGPSTEALLPVVVATSQFPSATLGGPTPAAFFDAHAALVRFGPAVTSQRNLANQTFKIGASGFETRFNPVYLKLADGAYAAPTDGTTLLNATGIVGIDLSGTVSPRGPGDVK